VRGREEERRRMASMPRLFIEEEGRKGCEKNLQEFNGAYVFC
jgi:hypothetical protein